MTKLKELHQLQTEVAHLRSSVAREAAQLGARWHPVVAGSPFEQSAANLACYLALRRQDIRTLQERLKVWGLSSLGRCEGHVLATLDAVNATLNAIAGKQVALAHWPERAEFCRGADSLLANASHALGVATPSRRVRILVTLPTEAAVDYAWVKHLLRSGADAVRINCAHDTPDDWERMIRHVRKAARALKRACPVAMDLTGPRVRTTATMQPTAGERAKVGDAIVLTREVANYTRRRAFQAQCTLPEIFGNLPVGRLVWFNEGRLGATVEQSHADSIVLKVTHARPQGEKFRDDMAINLPGTELPIAPLTNNDLDDLDFAVRHADLVGYSFVQRPDDISLLLGELDARRAKAGRKGKLGVIAKIETASAVRNLPEIIVRGASRGPFAVMIARGDLAVEIGFLRIAEIQEEILWICEAAHVPVIWATQVLESLAKKGVPSRAEITDAAMSERAECVMLNKGPYVTEAVKILDALLKQMGAHQHKKQSTLRALKSWDHLWR